MKKSLYEPYDPRLKHPGLFQKSFYYNSVHISLRPFLIPDDFILYNSWLGTVISKDPKQVKEGPLITEDYFDAIALASDSQCISGLINAEPVFVAELYPCMVHCPADLVQVIMPEPGDILLHLFIKPSVLDDERICEYILSACLCYLAGFYESERVFWIIDAHSHYSRVSAKDGILLSFAQGKEVYKYELALYR